MIKQCESCIHKQVCSLKNECERTVDNLSKNIPIHIAFELKLTCKNFSSEPLNRGYSQQNLYSNNSIKPDNY